MFDFVRLPNPIERLEFDWVRLVFCSVLFDWIGRDYYVVQKIGSTSVAVSVLSQLGEGQGSIPEQWLVIEHIQERALSSLDWLGKKRSEG